MNQKPTRGWMMLAKRRWFYGRDLHGLFQRRMRGDRRRKVWWFWIEEIT